MIKKNSLIFPITLILCFLFFLYIIKPGWDDYSSNKIKLDEKTEEIKKIRQNKHKLDEVSRIYKSEITVEEKSLVKNAIPVGFSQEEFLHDLNLILITTGIKMKSVNFLEYQSRKPEEEKLPKIEVELNLIGNYFQTKKALYMIENMGRLVRIVDFNMKTQTEISSLDVKIGLEVFYKEGTRDLIPAFGDGYFNDLLNNGLRVDLVKRYIKYRGTPSEFNFKAESEVGKENLFQTGDDYIGNTEEINTDEINIEEISPEENTGA